MSVPRHLAGLSIACLAGLALAIGAIDAGAQTVPAEPPPPTPIEHALLEHACGAMHPPGSVETEAYLDCRRNRLLYLRAEFGRDLRRLTPGERKTVDDVCSALRASRGQDAYVMCLQAQLAGLPGHKKATPAAAAAAAVVPAPPSPAPVAPAPAPPSTPFSILWLGGGLAALLVAAGAAVLMRNTRTPPASGKCRTCGVALHERGELCHACRHAAAETLRHTKTARADHTGVEEEAQRKLAAREREQQQARAEEARRQQLEAAEAAQARQREADAQRRREDDAWRQRELAATAAPDAFDPHAVLGVPRGASAADIEAAYQEARAKYDLDLVADLSAELQEHYKRKGAAARRAYETLIAEPSAS